ncbi:MAG: transposase [Nitrospinae bacterium]|nr:transposase [Nitrospinota bacterium]
MPVISALVYLRKISSWLENPEEAYEIQVGGEVDQWVWLPGGKLWELDYHRLVLGRERPPGLGSQQPGHEVVHRGLGLLGVGPLQALGREGCTRPVEKRTGWNCLWIIAKLKKMGFEVKIFVTDGLKGYLWAIPRAFHKAIHQICLFHYKQNITKFVKEHCSDEKERENGKKEMKRVTQGREGVAPIEESVA